MKIVKSVAEMQSICRELRTQGVHIGFVPTMVHFTRSSRPGPTSRSECQTVVASIFVNPLQFAPEKTSPSIPRTFEDDCRQLEAEEVAILFAPEAKEMYQRRRNNHHRIRHRRPVDGASAGPLHRGSHRSCQAVSHRRPARAYFGQKDAAADRRPATDGSGFNFDLELVSCAIVRDADGLALSSRNRYVSVSEREQALVCIVRSLKSSGASPRANAQLNALADWTNHFGDRNGRKGGYLAIVDADRSSPWHLRREARSSQ